MMTSNYLERIVLSNPTHIMSMADPVTIGVKTPRIDSECFLEKDFTELIHKNPEVVLYPIVNHVDSCHGCVCGPLT